jgi:hypothetical protein
MGKKKTAAKAAPAPAPEPSLQDFEAEIATTLNEGRIRLEREIRCMKQHQNTLYEEVMKRGRAEGYERAQYKFAGLLQLQTKAPLEARREGYEKGLREGEERGRLAKREKRETKRESEEAQTQPTTRETTDSSTETTTSSTADASMQTAPLDEPTATLSPPPSPATSPLSTAPSVPSTTPTTSTTTTTTCPSASKLPPTPLECRHQLPDQPTPPQPSPQPLRSHPEPLTATATSSSTTVPTAAAIAPKTSTWTAASTQPATPTSETANHAVNGMQRQSTAQQTALRAYAPVCSTDEPYQPHHRQRRSRSPPTPSCHPQLAPQPISHHEPSSTTATSPSTRLSTTAKPSALPHLGPRATAQRRRNTLPEPSEHPQTLPQRPCSPQNPCERAVSPPPIWYTPPASPTTPSTPTEIPRLPPAPPLLYIAPAAAVLRPPFPVPPPSSVPPSSTSVPARFDWAEDASSMPTNSSMQPRDLSGLRTSCLQPFGTLRRQTRRRRAPPRPSFIPSRQFPHPDPAPYALPYITRRHLSGIGPGKPSITIPIGEPPAPASFLNLNWDQDPRLASLSQALRALGWTPPC